MIRIENPLRTNPSRTTWIVLGTLGAVGIGAAIFFRTRRAAAASAGKQAFAVSSDCSQITIVDESAARAAAAAAALAVRPSPSTPALQAALDALRIVLPQCDWTHVPSGRSFVMAGQSTTWGQIETALIGKSVAELTQLVGGYTDEQLPIFVYWLLQTPPGAMG